MKCSDITDEQIYEAIKAIRGPMPADEFTDWSLWVSRWDLQARFPDVPKKLLDAKLSLMVRKRRLNGCSQMHNCRGDFHLPGES